MSPEILPAPARRITTSEPRLRADLQNAATGPHARASELSPPDGPRIATREADSLPLAATVRALDMTPDAVIFFTADLRIRDVNAAAVRHSGFRRGELQLLALDDLLLDDGPRNWRAGIARVLSGEDLGHSAPALLRAKNGELSPVRFEVQAVHDSAGPLLVAVIHCRRDERDARDLLSRPRHFDYLTNLPTRSALEYRLRRAERHARRQRSRFAVLFLDLDRFKEVNDLYGHRVGDRVLRAFAERLNACVRPGDFVARYGGDEFVVLVEDVGTQDELERMAERIQSDLQVTLHVGPASLAVSVSVGLAIGREGASAEVLVDEADRAMYAAKRGRR